MAGELSSAQIDKLFAFVRSKYVRWVDLQYEIVDHLATSIEELQKNDPNLSFDKALDTVYSQFPITGFTNLVTSKEKSLHRYWARKYFNIMKSYFQLPKILITIGLTTIIYYSFILGGQVGLVFIAAITLLSVLYSIYFRYRNGYINKKLTDKYLFTNTFLGISSGVNFAAFQIPLQIGNDLLFKNEFNHTRLLITSLMFALILIWTHAEINYFPGMLKDEINKKYSHLDIEIA